MTRAAAGRPCLLCLGRKNAKSAIVAVYLLGHLVGPLAMKGWRAGVCSVDKLKAAELTTQMKEIAQASGLLGMTFWRSPAPGWIEGPHGRVDVLSADRSSGHAAGYDLAVVDELGLLQERDRPMVNGMRTSISAKNGRFLALSIMGDSPFCKEMVRRGGTSSCTVHLYQPEDDADPFAEATWRAGNPGLGTIKSLSYMRDRAEAALASPADLADFKAFDLNLPQDPAREMICSPEEWRACVRDAPPPRDGEVFVGIDAGGSSSMTAAALVWGSGRMECVGAFPVRDGYGLRERGRGDAVGDRYQQLHDAGEIRTYQGRTTPVADFLRDLHADLAGETVVCLGADRYRKEEVLGYLEAAEVDWPVVWRGQGKSATADGSADIRLFQRAVLDRWLHPTPGRLMVHAIAESALVRDPLGNPAIEKARQRGRIDPLSAAVIAVGLAERARTKRRRGYRSAIVG